MNSEGKRPTKRWAAATVAAGTMSALLASSVTAGAAPAATRNVTEKPIMSTTDVRPGVVSLHAWTNPVLQHATVYYYELVNGHRKYIGFDLTGPGGRSHERVHMQPGTTHRFVSRVVHLNRHASARANATGVKTRYHSKYSNVVKYRMR